MSSPEQGGKPRGARCEYKAEERSAPRSAFNACYHRIRARVQEHFRFFVLLLWIEWEHRLELEAF